MKTKSAPSAEASAPAVIPPASEPALNLFTFDENGDCTNPETFVVKVPRGANCAVLLAQDPDTGKWCYGLVLSFSAEDTVSSTACREDAFAATREEALVTGLTAAQGYFAASPKNKLAKKCAGEVDAQLIALGSSPANTKAPRTGELPPLPEPENATLDPFEVEFDPKNHRGEIDPADPSVIELAETIASTGQLQPVGVRLIPDGGLPGVEAFRRQIMWGNRRLAACRLKKMPIAARVYRNISDEQARLVMQLENLQRKDIDPIQEAKGYADMMRDFDLSQEDIARTVRKSRPVVANALRLLDLPESVQKLLTEQKLTLAHGTALCRFKDWPKACAKIAELAVAEKSSASMLEKNLPFGEDLVRAKLAVDFCSYDCEAQLDLDQVKRLAKTEKGIFAWYDEEIYEDFGFCLDLELAKRVIAEEKKKEAERAAKSQSEAQRNVDEERESGGPGLSPAEKRARQKKLDENVKNRLECAAIEHAALERLSTTREIDVQSVLIVCAEALKHDGGEIDEVAKRIGITLPKDFDDSKDWGYAGEDHGLKSLAKLKPADAIALCAAALLMRDARDSMRYASGVPDYCEMGARENVAESLDAPSYVAEWHEKIVPLVLRGARADDVVARLQCPEFIAVNLVRKIRRDMKEANVPILSKEDAALLDKIGEAGLRAMRSEFSQSWSKTNSELAKIFDKTTAADVAAIRRLEEQEKAYAAAFKKEEAPEKPKPKKAAPAKKAKKGGKKK